MDRPDLPQIKAAADRLRPLIHRTPIVTSRLLDEAAGRRVFLKAECLQKAGSFKIRGAATALQALGPDARNAGIVAHSSGNHAQAVALAARQFGVDAVVVMPEDANRLKVAATKAYGAMVVQDGVTTANRGERADQYVRQGRYLIHPFDDWSVITGQGTLGLEIAEDAPEDIEMVLFPIGGGGLISGSAIVLRALRPDARIIGGHPDPVQILNLQGLLIDPLDQGFAQDKRQGFAWEAAGAVPGRDDGNDFHNLPMVARGFCELKNFLAH